MGSAQYLHFSQFDLTPLSVNPGNTGFHNGNWRAMAMHRNQWYGFSASALPTGGGGGSYPFITNALGFDMPFYIYNHRVSAGIVVINDQTSNIKMDINQIYLSGAYEKRFGGHLFSFGIQPGYVYKARSDGSIYPSQYNRELGHFDGNQHSNEASMLDNYGYFDLNAGVVYKKLFGAISPEFGIAVGHINMPKESFVGSENRLSLRETFHAKVNIPVGSTYFMMPTLLFMEQARSTQWTLGTSFGMNMPEENSMKIKNIFAGARFRNGLTPDLNALMPFVGAEIKNFRIGFNYDIDLSSFNPASNYEGAYEIGIIYISPSTRFSKITIPCDRY